jgi:hypothetical protein
MNMTLIYLRFTKNREVYYGQAQVELAERTRFECARQGGPEHKRRCLAGRSTM